MAKTSPENSCSNLTTLKFGEFWDALGQQLNGNTLLVNKQAETMSSFFSPQSDHCELLREIIITSFERSNCQTPMDSINLGALLDVMGEAAFERQVRQEDDLLDIELLEEIAFHIQQQYVDWVEMLSERQDSSSKELTGGLIYMNKAKTRRANSKI